jgi:protein gp37
MLSKPLSWRKPTTVFVNSMSDLFHESFTNEEIAAVFGVMAACPQHVFQVLTKRAERMRDWFRWYEEREAGASALPAVMTAVAAVPGTASSSRAWYEAGKRQPWPLPHVHLGVSVEDQQRADERIPLLLQTPAALHWLSCEPLLGPVDLKLGLINPPNPILPAMLRYRWDELRWVVVGGESGPGARPMNVEWARSLVSQCKKFGTACFVKQLGANYCDAVGGVGGRQARPPADIVQLTRRLTSRKGSDMREWPPDLRVREMPEPQR